MNIKRPIVSSIFISLIPVLFLTISGVAIGVAELSETQSIVAQTVAFVLSLGVGLLIVKKSGITFRGVGFSMPERGSSKAVLYYIPLIVAVLSILIPGFGGQIDLTRMLLLMTLTVFVGIAEELYFRGIIIQRMKKIGIKKAALISSALFGILHLPNILALDVALTYVLIQIVFATAFGVAAVVIVLITKSLLPAIIWHFLHNFTVFIARPFELDTMTIVLTSAQMLIMIVYAAVLWKRIPNQIQEVA